MTHADYLAEYCKLPESLRKHYLTTIPEWARDHCELVGERRLRLKRIDANLKAQGRQPIPFVMAAAPRGTFPKWFWDSLKKGHVPEGKKVF